MIRPRHRRSLPLWATAALALVSGIGSWFGLRAAFPQETTVETLLHGLQHNLDQIETLQGTLSCWPASGGYEDEDRQKTQQWRFAMAPEGCREEEMPPGLTGGLPAEVWGFDGQSVWHWSLASNTAGIAHDLARSKAFDFILGRFSLSDRFNPDTDSPSESIAQWANLRVVGTESVGGVDCYRVEGTRGGQDDTWWIAPDRGFQVKRHDWTYAVEKPRDATVIRTRWSMAVEEFAEFEGGIWLPAKVKSASTHIHADGTETPGDSNRGALQTFEVINLTVNGPVDEKLFQPRLLLSTIVTEEGTRNERPVPGVFGIGKG